MSEKQAYVVVRKKHPETPCSEMVEVDVGQPCPNGDAGIVVLPMPKFLLPMSGVMLQKTPCSFAIYAQFQPSEFSAITGAEICCRPALLPLLPLPREGPLSLS